MKRLFFGLLCTALLLGAVWLSASLQSGPSPIQASIDLQGALSDPGGEFAQVQPGQQLHFPQDHGEHPDYKTEWWYFTGTLTNKSGGEHGYQLTLFRTAVSHEQANSENPSRWSAKDIFMGHFALSDVNNARFVSFERFSRRALGLAGVQPEAKTVWLEDWTISREPDGRWKLSAREGTYALDLTLTPTKPVVLQGVNGYSRKGPEQRHASYYASITRFESRGRLVFDGQEQLVEGLSWFDHEWSSTALAKGLVGWDWFSLHLDDGSDLMLYLLRYADGRLEPASSGSLVDRSGRKTHLELSDFSVEILRHHRSPSGVDYPSGWKLRVNDLKLELTPLIADQEVASTVPYWEGAVKVSGDREGRGFVEMTGY